MGEKSLMVAAERKSSAAPPPIDRESDRMLPAFKKAAISLDAKRRPLERLVRRSGLRRSGWQPHAPTTPERDHALHDGRSVGTTLSTVSRKAQRAFI